MRLGLKLKTVRKSHNKKKKFDAVFVDKVGHEKVVAFGAKGYSDFTKHKNTRRKTRYMTRHKRHEDWNTPNTPGALSRWILWNKPSLKASIKNFKQKFHL